ncbi:hypothetical protein [Amycolatopsis sp. NPDC051128]|uniref:hypothetical protein n=1 Tax=Amycolatopsis sp. NPDC051128 TaxID=3155412 RepID=UPI003425AC50
MTTVKLARGRAGLDLTIDPAVSEAGPPPRELLVPAILEGPAGIVRRDDVVAAAHRPGPLLRAVSAPAVAAVR